MSIRSSTTRVIGFVVLAGVSQLPMVGAPRASDLTPTQQRARSVLVARQLSAPRVSNARVDLVNPFNPPGFDAPATRETENVTRAPAPLAAVVAPLSNQEILEKLSRQFPATGVMVHGDRCVLTGGPRPLEVGHVVTVSFEGKDYDVVIAAISPRAFTLRYRESEVSRPIYLSR